MNHNHQPNVYNIKLDWPKEMGELLDVEDEIDSMKLSPTGPRRVITAKRPSKKRKNVKKSPEKKPDRKILTSLLSNQSGLPNSLSGENW